MNQERTEMNDKEKWKHSNGANKFSIIYCPLFVVDFALAPLPLFLSHCHWQGKRILLDGVTSNVPLFRSTLSVAN